MTHAIDVIHPDKPANALKTLWITRAPGPTATGLAYRLGWLSQTFGAEGIGIECLQESSTELRRHHYDHRLPTMIREGGNIQAIGARGQGEATKLVGLTWVDEAQAIITAPGRNIRSPHDLKGLRLALPAWLDHPVATHQKASSIARGMSLQGYRGVLASAGLTWDDVKLVEVDGSYAGRAFEAARGAGQLAGLWSFHALLEGKVDALYVKGAAAIDAAGRFGLVSAIAIDDIADPRFRINNGTPRPITVHENLLEHHYDTVVTFLALTLKASDWATDNITDMHKILEAETRASAAAVTQAYSGRALQGLRPTLDDQRLDFLDRQKTFLWIHGFIERDFDIKGWIDPSPLADAQKWLAKEARNLTGK